MPNHCSNLLSSTGDKSIIEIIEPYLTENKKSIDFNKILPMPEGILKTLNSSSIEEITKERTPEEREAREKEQELLQDQNEKEYGYRSWYDWCVANWDTKWNAYSCWTLEENDWNDIQDFSDIGFQTAWSPPINVIRELSKLTGQPLRMSYYDEGWMFGGVYHVNPDGTESDETYNDPADCPEELHEELDVQYYLDLKEEEE